MGENVGRYNTTGFDNTGYGNDALENVTTGNRNIGVGPNTLGNLTTGAGNVAIGNNAGAWYGAGSAGEYNRSSTNSIYIGPWAWGSADGNDNEIVIGANAVGNGTNTVTIGNSSVTDTYLAGTCHIGTLAKLTPLAAAPASSSQGMIALANRTGWDPLTKGSGGPYLVWYDGSAWVSLTSQ